MKTLLNMTIVFLLIMISLSGVVILGSPLLLQAEIDQGRLVFTDLDGLYIFDLNTNIRSALPSVRYEDVGSVSAIDEQYIYVWACLAQNNPMFCTAPVSDIIAPEEVRRLDAVKQIWQEDYGSPIWSSDGKHIAFVISSWIPPDYQGDIYVMDVDGTNLLDLTPDETNNGFTFTWSPDSQQIAFACHDRQFLCIAHRDGSKLQQIAVAENTILLDLTWSPDGKQIAFVLIDREYHNSKLYVVNADGSNLHRLLEAGSDLNEQPMWSPDGSKIVFRAGEQNNNVGEIYVIAPDGTGLVNLSKSLKGNEFGAAWSPDSSSVAFFSAQEGTDMFLYTTHADGTHLQQITDNSTWKAMDSGSPEVFWLP